MPISYERVKVTPALAKKWLGLNAENNRPPKTGKIPGYARDMLAGNWNSDSGETIKFDENGVLIDGQNRLAAVVMAGVPVEFDVATGLPSSAMLVIDTGKPRSAADALHIAGVGSERMRAAAVIRWITQWDAKNFTGSGGRGATVATNLEVIGRYEADAKLFDTAAQRGSDCQRAGLSTGAVAGVAFFLFARIDLELSHQFFDQLVSGAELPGRSAVLALRNRALRARIDRVSRPEQLALFIRAWNFWRAGTPTDRLLIARGELTNANFPQPR